MKSTLHTIGFSMITFMAIAKYDYDLMGAFKNSVQTQRSLTIAQQLLLGALIKMWCIFSAGHKFALYCTISSKLLTQFCHSNF